FLLGGFFMVRSKSNVIATSQFKGLSVLLILAALLGSSPGIQDMKQRHPCSFPRPIRHFIAHSDYVQSLSFSKDGNRLATLDGSIVKVWNALEGTLLTTIGRSTDPVSSMVWPAGANFVICGHWDGTLRRWNAVSGNQLGPNLESKLAVVAMSLSEDGNLLATVG